MKYLIFVLALFGHSILFGQASDKLLSQAEDIRSFTRVEKNLNFYLEQAVIWKKIVKKESNNNKAWLNYLKAAYYANHFSENNNPPYALKDIYTEAKEHISGTFEYFYMDYILSRDCTILQKAYALEPNNVLAFSAYQACNMINGNQKGIETIAKKWYASKDWSPSIFKYNYNVLASLAPNALLMTWGDNDTYPALTLQAAKDYRKDVGVICMPLLFKEEYRTNVFQQNHIPPFGKSSEAFPNEMDYYVAILNHLIEKTDRPTYIGIAGSNSLNNKYEDSLYLVGLAYKFSVIPFDNISEIKRNYENRYLVDYLRVDLDNDISAPIAHTINQNYLPAFLLLYDHYKKTSDSQKANNLKTLIKTIAKSNNKEASVEKYFEKPAVIVSNIKARNLDGSMKKIKGNLYASETETSIESYEAFLKDLLTNKQFDKIEICKTIKTEWRALLPENKKHLSDKILFFDGKRHPDNPNYPIQNISWEAANEYCQWVTQVYNQSTERKKKYKKVIFRLPTEQEWEMAALAGHNQAKYPWGDFDIKNSSGCYLCNFDAPICTDCKKASGDGSFFPASTDSYFPNDLGFYNMGGNVAEMLDNQNLTKGGGWQDTSETIAIKAKLPSNAPSPNIGFRVFMEVIEE